MKRAAEHVIGERSMRLVADLLPPEWIVRELPRDYGVDLEVELVDQAIVSGNRIWVQLKGTTRLKPTKELNAAHMRHDRGAPQRYVGFSVPTPLLEYALRCGVPLLLFVADLEREEVYWLPLRDEIEVNLEQRSPRWREQATATIRIPVENNLRSERDASWRGLRWYALEPARNSSLSLVHALHHELKREADLSQFYYDENLLAGEQADRFLRALQIVKVGMERMTAIDEAFAGNALLPAFITERLRLSVEWTTDLEDRVRQKDVLPTELLHKAETIRLALQVIAPVVSLYHLYRNSWLLFEPGVSRRSPLTMPEDELPR